MQDAFRSDLVALLPRLRRFAWSLAGNPAAADDLVQAACIRALSSSEQWQPGTRLDSWMFRILQNLWIDERRRRMDNATDALGEDIDGLADEDDLETRMMSKLSLESVLTAMETLPEQARVLIALVSIDGLSYKEAAEVLQLPLGTVMSRLARARLALRRALEGTPV